MISKEIIDIGTEELKRTLENIIIHLEGLGGKDRLVFDLAEVELMISSGNRMGTSLLLRDGVVTVGRQALRDLEKNKLIFCGRALRVLNAYYEYALGLQSIEIEEEEAIKLGSSLLRNVN